MPTNHARGSGGGASKITDPCLEEFLSWLAENGGWPRRWAAQLERLTFRLSPPTLLNLGRHVAADPRPELREAFAQLLVEFAQRAVPLF